MAMKMIMIEPCGAEYPIEAISRVKAQGAACGNGLLRANQNGIGEPAQQQAVATGGLPGFNEIFTRTLDNDHLHGDAVSGRVDKYCRASAIGAPQCVSLSEFAQSLAEAIAPGPDHGIFGCEN